MPCGHSQRPGVTATARRPVAVKPEPGRPPQNRLWLHPRRRAARQEMADGSDIRASSSGRRALSIDDITRRIIRRASPHQHVSDACWRYLRTGRPPQTPRSAASSVAAGCHARSLRSVEYTHCFQWCTHSMIENQADHIARCSQYKSQTKLCTLQILSHWFFCKEMAI
jgi:hypothetical protein